MGAAAGVEPGMGRAMRRTGVGTGHLVAVRPLVASLLPTTLVAPRRSLLTMAMALAAAVIVVVAVAAAVASVLKVVGIHTRSRQTERG